ncbi:MAG: hypothetical protein IAG13_31335 [Deltaproteobacteria bacterium]|nr:hypothetical protein [Nannocystaceae bacterium]
MALVAALLLTPSIACGKIFGAIAEQDHLGDVAEAYEFDLPLSKLWDEARIVLEEDGYRLVAAPVLDETVRCEGPSSTREREWINLRVTKTSGGKLKVSMHRVGEEQRDGKWQPERGGRARMLEWKLVARVDPELSESVGKRAAEKKDKAEKLGTKAQEAAEDFAELLGE